MKIRKLTLWILLLIATVFSSVTADDRKEDRIAKAKLRALIEDVRNGKRVTEQEFKQVDAFLESIKPTALFKKATSGANPVFSEDFSSGGLPAGWTVVDNNNSGEVWLFSNPGLWDIYSTTGENGIAIFDSDNFGSRTPSEDSDLISPIIDCSTISTVVVSFEHYFRAGFGGKGEFSVSADSGATWTVLGQWEEESSYNAEPEFFDITSIAAGQSQVMLRWNWRGNYSWFWAVDDVMVSEPTGGELLASEEFLEFGVVAVNESDSQTVSLKNAGLGVEITAITSDNPAFSVINPPIALATAGEDSFVISFNPTTVGPDSGLVTIESDAGNSPLVIEVWGYGFETPVLTIPWEEPFAKYDFDPKSWDYLSFEGYPEIVDNEIVILGPIPYDLPSDPYILEISGEADIGDPPDVVATGIFDLTAASSVVLSFWKSEHDLEIGEYVLVEYMAGNGQWQTLDSLAGTDNGFGVFEPFEKKQYFLPGDAYHANFQLRFAASPQMEYVDHIFIDDISLAVGNILPIPRNLLAASSDMAVDLAWEVPEAVLNQLLHQAGAAPGKSRRSSRLAKSSAVDTPMLAQKLQAQDELLRYRIYRSTDGENFAVHDSVDAAVTQYTDSNLSNGTSYWYYVTAVFDIGESDPSPTVTGTPVKLANNVLLFESFEGEFPPPGWSKFNLDGGSGWVTQPVGSSPISGWVDGVITGPSAGGTSVAFVTWNTGGDFSNDQWLVTPQFRSVQEDDSLCFWLRYWPPDFSDTLDVRISTSGNRSPAHFDILVESLGFGPAGDSTDVWRKYAFRIGDYVRNNENIYIAFHEHVQDNFNDGGTFSIDLFSYISNRPAQRPQKLLISEIAVAPDSGEFIEIYNPSTEPVQLGHYYLTDATSASRNDYYYQIVAGGGGGGDRGDWHIRFPAGASIQPRQYQTIAVNAAAFAGKYGVMPTYELNNSDDNVPDVLPAFSNSIPTGINMLNDVHEGIIFYFWNGETDLVSDVDYVVYGLGSPSEQIDKTDVAMDGPDVDSDASSYLPDTPTARQALAPVAAPGLSTQRIDFTEGAQTVQRGNGVTGADETSEDLNNTFSADNQPTPGQPSPGSTGLNPPRNLRAAAEEGVVNLHWQGPLPNGELGYDDDSSETGMGLVGGAGELAVRFTPTSYPATLVKIKTLWLDIAGARNSISYSIWTNRAGGDAPPVNRVLAEQPYTVVQRDAFSEVDVSGANLTINEGDFYVSWRQPTSVNYGLGLDTDGADYSRAWLSLDGGISWAKLEDLGLNDNLMVRALVVEGGGSNPALTKLAPASDEQEPAPVKDKTLMQEWRERVQLAHPVNGPISQRLPELLLGAGISMNEPASATGFNIWRSLDGQDFSMITSVDASQSSYTDATVDNNTTYWYSVTRVTDNAESPPSNVVQVRASDLTAALFADHITSQLRASVTNEGTIGYLGASPPDGMGNGFAFNPNAEAGQRLFDGGIIIASDAEHVSDGARNDNWEFDSDFRRLAGFDSSRSAGDLHLLSTMYDDAHAEAPIGVQVTQTSFSSNNPDGAKILGFELKITNTSGATLPAVHAGAFLDWDVAFDYNDRGRVVGDSTNLIAGINDGQAYGFDFLEMHAGDSPDAWIGVVPLSSNRFSAARILVNENEVYPPHMVDADKWAYITQNRSINPTGDGGSAQDHSQIFGLSPFALEPDSSRTVGFAIIAGVSLQDLVNSARMAQSLWKNELGNKMDVISTTSVDDVAGAAVPTEFSLEQNYPNPFNPSTTIKFSLPEASDVMVTVHDLLGRNIRTLVAGASSAGHKTIVWNGLNQHGNQVASGVYVVRMVADNFTAIRKIMLIR